MMATDVARRRREARLRRHRRIRQRIRGTGERPRLAVFRSLRHISAQVIDDHRGHTIASASTAEPLVAARLAGLAKTARASVVGQVVAERAMALGVTSVVLDRGGYRYHGRVRALADAAREAGLHF